MTYTNVLQIINALASTTKSSEKIAILRDVDQQDIRRDFLAVVDAAMNPDKNFFMRSINDTIDVNGFSDKTISIVDAITSLYEVVAARQITGNTAKEFVSMLYSELTKDDRVVFSYIIKRDLRCGVAAKTINTVWPNFIRVSAYMRCSSFNEKNIQRLKYPCYSQTKMDGLFVNVIVPARNAIEVTTRVGTRITDKLLTQENKRQLFSSIPTTHSGYVFQGEAVAAYDKTLTTIMPREESNGYLNSDDVDPERVIFFLWDVIPIDEYSTLKYNVSYKERYQVVNTFIDIINSPRYRIVFTQECNNKTDLIESFKTARSNGEEGVIGKNFDGIWKNGTSSDQIKIKDEFIVDLKIVGYKLGTGKYIGMLGSLICETSDGLLQTFVGSGFSDTDRKSMLAHVDDWVDKGQIVSVKANAVTTGENRDTKCLYLPRIIEVRYDKEEADSLERVYEQENAFFNVLDEML